jgi:hypothetical protein
MEECMDGSRDTSKFVGSEELPEELSPKKKI